MNFKDNQEQQDALADQAPDAYSGPTAHAVADDDEPSGFVIALTCDDGTTHTVAAEDITDVSPGLVRAGLQLYAVTPAYEQTARRVLAAFRGAD